MNGNIMPVIFWFQGVIAEGLTLNNVIHEHCRSTLTGAVKRNKYKC